MKLSEQIKQLQKLLDEHGDLEIFESPQEEDYLYRPTGFNACDYKLVWLYKRKSSYGNVEYTCLKYGKEPPNAEDYVPKKTQEELMKECFLALSVDVHQYF